MTIEQAIRGIIQCRPRVDSERIFQAIELLLDGEDPDPVLERLDLIKFQAGYVAHFESEIERARQLMLEAATGLREAQDDGVKALGDFDDMVAKAKRARDAKASATSVEFPLLPEAEVVSADPLPSVKVVTTDPPPLTLESIGSDLWTEAAGLAT